MQNPGKNIVAMSDSAILELLGNFIKENRIRQNKTQQDVAAAAGVSRTTVIQMEAGSGGNLLTFIQVLRAIDQLYVLKNFEVEDLISPIALAKIQLNKRVRAGRSKKNTQSDQPKSNW